MPRQHPSFSIRAPYLADAPPPRDGDVSSPVLPPLPSEVAIDVRGTSGASSVIEEPTDRPFYLRQRSGIAATPA